jgi:hypothetical protein
VNRDEGAIGSTGRIAAGRRNSVGIAADGFVLTAGRADADGRAVDGWTDIVAVAVGNVHTARNTGRSHTVGLRSDGRVLAAGWDSEGPTSSLSPPGGVARSR